MRQKKQAILLCHYASLEYLKPMHGMVNAIIKDIDATLQRASDEGRDRLYIVSVAYPSLGYRQWRLVAYPERSY